MKKSLIIALSTIATLTLCSTAALAKKPATLFQVSTTGALSQGVFDGDFPYQKLKKQGNFGVGTFKGVDGEMIALDGRFYQTDSSGKKPGKLKRVQGNQIAPFAEVINFKPYRESNIEHATSLTALEEMIVERLPNRNIPYAIEIDGRFQALTLRNLRKQGEPYRPLRVAARNQSVLRLHNKSGHLVGFWFPKYWAGIAPTGLYLNFVNSTHTIGGHVTNVSVRTGKFESEPINNVKIYLPHTLTFANAHLARRRP